MAASGGMYASVKLERIDISAYGIQELPAKPSFLLFVEMNTPAQVHLCRWQEAHLHRNSLRSSSLMLFQSSEVFFLSSHSAALDFSTSSCHPGAPVSGSPANEHHNRSISRIFCLPFRVDKSSLSISITVLSGAAYRPSMPCFLFWAFPAIISRNTPLRCQPGSRTRGDPAVYYGLDRSGGRSAACARFTLGKD